MLRVMITDNLASYTAAKRVAMPGVEHRSHEGLSNRAENSHELLRKRERTMQGFRSAGGLQRFISVFSAVRNFFILSTFCRSALANYLHRLSAMAVWKIIAYVAA